MDGRTRAWLANGTAPVGQTDDLDAHRAAQAVATGLGRRHPNPFDWQRAIALPHLPDRMTGFQHGGAIGGAMAMFGKDLEDPTHHDTHR